MAIKMLKKKMKKSRMSL